MGRVVGVGNGSFGHLGSSWYRWRDGAVPERALRTGRGQQGSQLWDKKQWAPLQGAWWGHGRLKLNWQRKVGFRAKWLKGITQVLGGCAKGSCSEKKAFHLSSLWLWKLPPALEGVLGFHGRQPDFSASWAVVTPWCCQEKNKTFCFLSRTTLMPTAHRGGDTNRPRARGMCTNAGSGYLEVSGFLEGSCILIDLLAWKTVQLILCQAQRWQNQI